MLNLLLIILIGLPFVVILIASFIKFQLWAENYKAQKLREKQYADDYMRTHRTQAGS